MADSKNTSKSQSNRDNSKENRRKMPSPKELYEMLVTSNLSLSDLRDRGLNEPVEILSKVIGHTKRLMDGAIRRATTHKGNASAFRNILVNRYNSKLTSSEVKSCRVKLVRERATRLACLEEARKYKDQHDTFVELLSKPYADAVGAAREDGYVKRMAPSRTNQVLGLIASISTNGRASEVEELKTSVEGPREVFRDKLMAIVSSLHEGLHDEFTERPKLLTAVVGRVVEHYQAEGRK